MADDLSELKERIQFCVQEAKKLSGDLSAITKGNFQIEQFIQPDGMIAIKAKVSKPIPISTRSRTGTIINELRSELDALACILAIRKCGNSSGTYFPISISEKVFLNDGLYKTRKLSKDDQAEITKLKPWKDGNPMLFALHNADIKRKHGPNLAAQAGNQGGMDFSHGVIDVCLWHLGQHLSDQWTTIGMIGPGTRAHFNLYCDIVFAEPPSVAGKRVVNCLKEFSEIVASIVAKFD